MPSDISRAPDDRREPNTGVVAQQGRVIVDRDLNTLQRIVNTRTETEARDVIGPSGTPDDGFAITLPQGSPPFWSPPAPLVLGTEPQLDFLIKPGTMYVGGQRVAFPSRQADLPITYAYFDQPDWPDPPPPVLGKAVAEAVYLQVTEHELSAVEDPDLLDVALGGVDTTQRLRLLRRVARTTVQSADCVTAWAELGKRWLTAGLSFDPRTMRLAPTARLIAGFDQSKAPPDPCDPVATGGYLGAENQLIRVQIGSPGTSGSPVEPPQLLWGNDNASFLYRVSSIASNATMLQIARDPPDAFHTPQGNQVVEILRTAAVIASEPDETDPTGQSAIIRCVAEETGFVTTLTRPYGPAIADSTTKFLVLAQPLPPAYASDTNPLFVRIWQGRQSFAVGEALDLVDPVTNATNGLQVTISAPPGEALTPGAYWQIAVRPSTPQLVYPERFLTAPQPPDGPREWVCPLAVIDWRTHQVHDCRQTFDNLVTLTKRPAGCCTVNIAPSDITADNTLQALIDRAAGRAEQVTVCLGPGVFELPGSLRLNALHNQLTLSSCAGGATLQADADSGSSAFTDGLVVVANASRVVLRGLRVTIPAGALPPNILAILQTLPQPAGSQPRDAANTAAMIGVRAVSSDALTIEDCAFTFAQPNGTPDIVGAAVFLQGDCSGLTVRDCTFVSDMQPTFTQPTPTANAVTVAGAATAAGAATVAGAATSAGAATAAGAAAVAGAGTVAGAAAAAGAATAGGAAAARDQAVATSAVAAVSAGASPGASDIFSVDTASRLRLIAAQSPVGIIVKASPPAPMIATIGVLASTSIVGNSSAAGAAESTALTCRLGDATVRGNSFTNLAMTAQMFGVDGKTVRLQDNDATACVAGLWIFLTDAAAPTGAGNLAEYTTLLTAFTGFREALLALVIGELYPLPTGAAGTPATPITPISLILTNNGFEAIPASGQGNVALFVSANRPVVAGADTTPSLLLAGNRLRSQSLRPRIPAAAPTPVPTVLLVMPDNERCVVTGNLILNENLQDVPGVSGGSLIILPNSSATAPASGIVTSNVSLLTVSANVLLGTTNLGALLRSTSAGDTWLPYNSVG